MNMGCPPTIFRFQYMCLVMLFVSVRIFKKWEDGITFYMIGCWQTVLNELDMTRCGLFYIVKQIMVISCLFLCRGNQLWGNVSRKCNYFPFEFTKNCLLFDFRETSLLLLETQQKFRQWLMEVRGSSLTKWNGICPFAAFLVHFEVSHDLLWCYGKWVWCQPFQYVPQRPKSQEKNYKIVSVRSLPCHTVLF